MRDAAFFLLVDGITNGFAYAIVALSLVLVFTVTRVVNIAQGEYVMLGALTFADLLGGRFPGTLFLLIVGAACAIVADVRKASANRVECLRSIGGWLALSAAATAVVFAALLFRAPAVLMMPVVVVVVGALGAVVYRFTVRPNPDASTITLVIVSVGVGMVLQGCGLLLWGPEPQSVAPLVADGVQVGGVFIQYQSLVIVVASTMCMIGLYAFSRLTLFGKALQAAAMNRRGAQFCGIPVERVGAFSFALAASFSALGGMLLAPLISAQYEMGFMVGLKGFVGAAMGGLVDYPLALLGVLTVGGLESVSAYSASAFRDPIVFGLLIPILLWRNARTATRRH